MTTTEQQASQDQTQASQVQSQASPVQSQASQDQTQVSQVQSQASQDQTQASSAPSVSETSPAPADPPAPTLVQTAKVESIAPRVIGRAVTVVVYDKDEKEVHHNEHHPYGWVTIVFDQICSIHPIYEGRAVNTGAMKVKANNRHIAGHDGVFYQVQLINGRGYILRDLEAVQIEAYLRGEPANFNGEGFYWSS